MSGPNETFIQIRLDVNLAEQPLPKGKPPQVAAAPQPGVRRPLGFKTSWDPWHVLNPLVPDRVEPFSEKASTFRHASMRNWASPSWTSKIRPAATCA